MFNNVKCREQNVGDKNKPLSSLKIWRYSIHDFHNGGPLGRSGNDPHQSEASKATIFISESGRVEKHANVFQIYLACRVVLVSLA